MFPTISCFFPHSTHPSPHHHSSTQPHSSFFFSQLFFSTIPSVHLIPFLFFSSLYRRLFTPCFTTSHPSYKKNKLIKKIFLIPPCFISSLLTYFTLIVPKKGPSREAARLKRWWLTSD